MAEDEGGRISVLFVCLGNICRSPMAEAVFKHTVAKHGLAHRFDTIDSAGTCGYHVGSPPDSRSSRTCAKYGVPVVHRARQVDEEDFYKFDYLLAMDTSNLEDLQELGVDLSKNRKDGIGKAQLFGDYKETGSRLEKVVRDPYYGGNSGFEDNFKQLISFSEEFLRRVLKAEI